MSVHIGEIVENFPDLLRLERGPKETPISALKAPPEAKTEHLIFVTNRQHLKEARESQAGAWIVHKDLLADVPAHVRVVISSPNVQLAMASVGRKHFPQTRHFVPVQGPKIHPSAQISTKASVASDCIVGPGAVIGDDCVIGAGAIIGANAVIEPGVKIGKRTHIHPLVFIGHGCEIGDDCEIKPNTTIGGEGFGYAQDAQFNSHRITHYGRVILEDRVHIGANVQIDRGTFLDSRIGAGAKIDNHCHFGHNIQIGKNTIITGGMITAGSTSIGSYCVFGGRTTISGHLSIADKTQVSGLSGISKSITKPGEYGGFPLQDLKGALKTRVAIRQLPKMIRQVRQIMQHLGLKTEDSPAGEE